MGEQRLPEVKRRRDGDEPESLVKADSSRTVFAVDFELRRGAAKFLDAPDPRCQQRPREPFVPVVRMHSKQFDRPVSPSLVAGCGASEKETDQSPLRVCNDEIEI